MYITSILSLILVFKCSMHDFLVTLTLENHMIIRILIRASYQTTYEKPIIILQLLSVLDGGKRLAKKVNAEFERKRTISAFTVNVPGDDNHESVLKSNADFAVS